jgi:hypothetical protein
MVFIYCIYKVQQEPDCFVLFLAYSCGDEGLHGMQEASVDRLGEAPEDETGMECQRLRLKMNTFQ